MRCHCCEYHPRRRDCPVWLRKPISERIRSSNRSPDSLEPHGVHRAIPLYGNDHGGTRELQRARGQCLGLVLADCRKPTSSSVTELSCGSVTAGVPQD